MAELDVVTTADTRRVITDLLERSSRHPLVLLALCIAESNLHEHAVRERGGCDYSYGLVQQSVCWIADAEAARAGMRGPKVNGRWPITEHNMTAALEWYWDAEHALGDAGPRIDALMARWADPIEALCRWNKPSLAGDDNPNRANYERAWRTAQEYLIQEEPMPTDSYSITAAMRGHIADNGDAPKGDEVYYTPDLSMCPGAKALYFYSKASNVTYACPKV